LLRQAVDRPSGLAPLSAAHRLRQPLIEIADDVGDALEADREAHHIGPGAGGDLLLGGELAMRRRCRMNDQRAGVADIGEMGEELDRLDQRDARMTPKVKTEPAPLGRYFRASAWYLLEGRPA
jgi:hypothetical protein